MILPRGEASFAATTMMSVIALVIVLFQGAASVGIALPAIKSTA